MKLFCVVLASMLMCCLVSAQVVSSDGETLPGEAVDGGEVGEAEAGAASGSAGEGGGDGNPGEGGDMGEVTIMPVEDFDTNMPELPGGVPDGEDTIPAPGDEMPISEPGDVEPISEPVKPVVRPGRRPQRLQRPRPNRRGPNRRGPNRRSPNSNSNRRGGNRRGGANSARPAVASARRPNRG